MNEIEVGEVNIVEEHDEDEKKTVLLPAEDLHHELARVRAQKLLPKMTTHFIVSIGDKIRTEMS